jgi:hypothetical protein
MPASTTVEAGIFLSYFPLHRISNHSQPITYDLSLTPFFCIFAFRTKNKHS